MSEASFILLSNKPLALLCARLGAVDKVNKLSPVRETWKPVFIVQGGMVEESTDQGLLGGRRTDGG